MTGTAPGPTCVTSTGDPSYERAAVAALSQLWSMRSPLDLVGTSIDMQKGHWNNRLGGTGAGADSFYEYLLKAYILFGKSDTDYCITAVLHIEHLVICLSVPMSSQAVVCFCLPLWAAQSGHAVHMPV